MRRVFISSVLAAFIPVAALAESSTTFMNARVVGPSADRRSLAVVGADGHTRTLPIEPRASASLAGLRMGDEIIVIARGREDSLVITGVRVVGAQPAMGARPAIGSQTALATPASLNASDYIAARRQRPNPYSLINPMFPRDSPKNPWARRQLAAGSESATVVPAVLRDSAPR
jgi:hypothetical protein